MQDLLDTPSITTPWPGDDGGTAIIECHSERLWRETMLNPNIGQLASTGLSAFQSKGISEGTLLAIASHEPEARRPALYRASSSHEADADA